MRTIFWYKNRYVGRYWTEVLFHDDVKNFIILTVCNDLDYCAYTRPPRVSHLMKHRLMIYICLFKVFVTIVGCSWVVLLKAMSSCIELLFEVIYLNVFFLAETSTKSFCNLTDLIACFFSVNGIILSFNSCLQSLSSVLDMEFENIQALW